MSPAPPTPNLAASLARRETPTVSRSLIVRFVGGVGRTGITFFASFRALLELLRDTIRSTLRSRPEERSVALQMYEIGNRSFLFLTVVMGFIGMILVLQAGVQSRRVVPDLSLLGATFIELLARDLAASLTALMLATRVGAGIAAEIGSMVVTEQVDALRMCAADPVDYLVKPRFLASLVMTGVLSVWSGAVALATGTITALVMFELRPATFLDFRLVHTGDLVVCFAKFIAYGAAIPIVAAHCGLTTFGGSEGVGAATTRAVVQGLLVVIALNLTISTIGFVLLGR